MQYVSVYKWNFHLGVYPVGTFILDLRFVKDGDGDQPDVFMTISIGKFVMSIGKFHVIVRQ